MAKGRVVILGAGPAGLAAAWKLTERGYQPDVIELKPFVGGMAYTIRSDGYLWDLGPHRFHSSNPAIINEIDKLLGDELEKRDRKTRVFFWNKMYDYPLNAGNLLKNLPLYVAGLSFLDFAATVVKNKIKPSPDDNFESWVVNRFGRRLYDIYFGPYTAKVWGRDPRKLSSSWAAQRVAVVDLWDLTLRTLGFRKGDNNFHHSEYKDLFYYPRQGVGRISEVIAEKAAEGGARIHLNARMLEVRHQKGRIAEVVYEQHGKTHVLPCDYLISTIPISSLVRSIRPEPPEAIMHAAQGLKFRAMIFLFLKLNKSQVTNDHWIYFPDPKVIFNRVSEMRNFSHEAAPHGKGSLTVEITCDIGDEIWTESEEVLYEKTIQGLVEAGLFKREEVIGHFFERLPNAYPSYDLNYEGNLAALIYQLSSFDNMITGGRQGLFRYINTDHALEMGFCAAQEIANQEIGTKVARVGDAPVYFG
ncbi:FAD-dependent oxidoreductase [Candidatus Chlorohelix sp.]|uniref:FAD-dependent oxidoreductase n=1 Tax=Candidatus Chlorohelix sp. TaxID=3139201 RepID=UPI003072A896